MARLVSVPTLIVNTSEGICSVKVSEPSIETALLACVAGWVQDGQAKLVRLPSNVLVTGTIVDQPRDEVADA